MKNKLTLLMAFLAAAAAIGFLLLENAITEQARIRASESHALIISEVCAKNETVIADNSGKYRDYIELYNPGETIDLAGCRLTNGKAKSQPLDGPVLEKGEYWLIFLGDEATGFRLGASGGDCIQLSDAAGNVLAQVNTVALTEDQVMLYHNGSYTVSSLASPGFAATKAFAGAEADTGVVISEVLVQNVSSLPDERGIYSDAVELYNPTSEAVCLYGWYLSDSSQRFTYRIPNVTLNAGDYLVIFCDGEDYISENGQLHANFALSYGEEIYLTDRQGQYSHMAVDYPGEDISLSLVDGSYEASEVSLGFPNTEDGVLSFRESRINYDSALVISEVLLSSADIPYEGKLQDVVELTNRSSQTVSTAGWYLSDGGDPYGYCLPERSLEPGECMVIVCSPQTTGFGLSLGETLRLTGPDCLHLPQISCAAGEPGQSLSLTDPKELTYGFGSVTLGYPNTEESTAAYRSSQLTDGLRISEVLSANASYLKGAYSETCDWLELYNASEKDILLSDYCITNNLGNLDKFPLPDRTLKAGEYCVIFLSNDTTNLLKGYSVLDFSISSQGEDLYLSRDGSIVDYVSVPHLDTDVSYGRPEGEVLFDLLEKVTPGKANSPSAQISAAPVALTPQGSYDGVEYIEVVLEGEGNIYYTTNCTAPDRYDNLYTGPIRITKTTVIRAVCQNPGEKASSILDLTYLINENDSLEAICIVTDPDNLFSDATGIYTAGAHAETEYPYTGANFWMDWERPATVSLFETDGSCGFSTPCGIKIFGNDSRTYNKKSLACMFRSQYGADALAYPLFGEEGLDTYEAFVLRAGGQEVYRSRMRDELITSLVGDHTQVPVQDCRPAVVYLNGKYYGFYFIREKMNEQYFAGNYRVSDQDVTICVWNGTGSAEYQALVRYAGTHNLAIREHYDYVCSLMDIDEYIDYMAAQIWVGNGDISNTKFFKLTGGKWQWILFDTDWGFRDPYYNAVEDHWNPEGTAPGQFISTELINALLRNADFRDAFLRRMAWQINTIWNTESVSARVDEFVAAMDADMVKECQRWGTEYEAWLETMDYLRNFPARRTPQVIQHIQEYFSLTTAQMRDYGFPV